MFYRDDLLRAAKGANRMTDKEIAARAQVNKQTVGRVLSGDPSVGFMTLKVVAEALGFTDLSVLTSAQTTIVDGLPPLEERVA